MWFSALYQQKSTYVHYSHLWEVMGICNQLRPFIIIDSTQDKVQVADLLPFSWWKGCHVSNFSVAVIFTYIESYSVNEFLLIIFWLQTVIGSIWHLWQWSFCTQVPWEVYLQRFSRYSVCFVQAVGRWLVMKFQQRFKFPVSFRWPCWRWLWCCCGSFIMINVGTWRIVIRIFSS